MIHPTAIIHPGAQVASGCRIGPYCTIGEHVALGDDCELISHVVLDGHTELGKGNIIYPFTTVGLRTQDLKYKGGLTRTRVGDFNIIRETVTIHSATGDGEMTEIGCHNTILAGSHIGHNVVLGDYVIVSMAAIAGHVLVEDYAIIGGMSAVHQFCRVGTMAMIAGCAKIVQDVAPYMLVEGNPAETRTINKIGLERRNVSHETQHVLRQAFKILFREGLTSTNALAMVEKELPQVPEIQHLLNFMRTSERGVTK